ncbi:MAG: helix-turn-helix transcriptional regulator [Clostridia bacterium]|nr:helix-turn-helix transcriptional regulator [Clostridia bacterium]
MSTFYEQRPEQLFIGGMTDHVFPAHVHSVAELVVVTCGSVEMTIDEMHYTLNTGDAAIVFPLVPHSYDVLSDDARGVTAIFPPDIIPEYAGTFHGLQPECPVLRAARTCVDLRLAVSRLECLTMEDDLPLCVAYLHIILAGLLHNLSYRPVYDYSEKDLGHRIIQYISEHAFEEITLESASRALGISISHLSHFFSERMHTNFRRFINAIRISKARLLMRDPNLTLTEISDACGYTNMRTFRRAFQAELGCLPSEHFEALRGRITNQSAF